jgi:hypothetical protein
MPEIFVDGKVYRPTAGPQGGQATFYRLTDSLGAKVFHEESFDSAYRDRIEFLCNSNIMGRFQHVATPPISLVKNSSGKTIGYTLTYLGDHVKLSELFTPDFYKNNKLGIKSVVHTFLQLHKALRFIHGEGFRVGDFNQTNIFVRFHHQSVDVKFIDTDGWACKNPSIGRQWDLPALNPYIVHPDIRIDDPDRRPDPKTLHEHDWFAYSMLLAICLFKMHPFGIGLLPGGKVLSDADRVKKRLSVWHHSVTLRRDDMLAVLRFGAKFNFVLRNWLTAKRRGEFPIEVLVELYQGLVRCPQCSFEASFSTRFCLNCFTKLPIART